MLKKQEKGTGMTKITKQENLKAKFDRLWKKHSSRNDRFLDLVAYKWFERGHALAMENNDFIADLLELAAEYELYLRFTIPCSDVFFWGQADEEEVTEADLPLLKKSLEDSESFGAILYCARKRKMRPNKYYYQYLDSDKKLIRLFDECKPKNLA